VSGDVILRVEGLRKWFPIRGGLLGRVRAYVRAVDGVSFGVMRGETFGIVGESGSGKTTLAKCILRLLEPTSGGIYFEGHNIATLKERELRAYRRKVQMIFQDPYASLDPRQTVKSALMEAMKAGRRDLSRSEALERALELIRLMGLNEDHLYRFPHEFSGGQRQRIAIARTLATEPELLVLDEPTSFLDVSVQAQILNLLKELQRKLGLTYIFISHNLNVISYMCDHVAVMYLGKVMELGERSAVYSSPRHPYTHALMEAIPIPDPDARRNRLVLGGEIASPIDPPRGCVFHSRCPYATSLCREKEPELREVDKGRLVACHYA
jgi:peptide/nickel transport system ATP-binding protein/oligopeptide transport system ATP-binding protein